MFYLHSLTATEARLSLFVNLVYYQKAEKQSFRKSSAGFQSYGSSHRIPMPSTPPPPHKENHLLHKKLPLIPLNFMHAVYYK